MEKNTSTRSQVQELGRETPTQTKTYLTRKQVRNEFHLSYPSILKYEKEGKLSGYQIGHRVLFDRAEIEASHTQRSFQ